MTDNHSSSGTRDALIEELENEADSDFRHPDIDGLIRRAAVALRASSPTPQIAGDVRGGQLERKLADIIREHVEIGYSFKDGYIDHKTIGVTGSTAAAHMVLNFLGVAQAAQEPSALAHPERLKALSDAADYVEKIGARYHSGRDIANHIRCLGPQASPVPSTHQSAPQLRTSQHAEMLPNGDAAGCGADTAHSSTPGGGEA